MKTLLTASLLALLPCIAGSDPGLAPWLQARIGQFEKLPPFSPPRAILRTSFGGKTVYYVTPACCDIPSELYEEGGTLLCYPSGGFAGGDGRCPAFVLGAAAVATVWRDERPRAARPKASAAK